jgi:asparagine synthase (glutamine-hydrolysing)
VKAICGFLHLDGRPAGERELASLRAGLVFNPEAYTGPGVAFEGATAGPVALGAARWSRQAVSPEPQLAQHADSGCIAVVDARLDERDALAAALGLSPQLPAARLVLHAWLQWGERCVDHLRGDFAFAVWDPRGQRLFCARDIMGVRPLYVHHTPGRLFAFASRAQSLLALPGVPGDFDEGRIADALVSQLESIDKTSTFFRAVTRLPPAHTASTDARGSRQQRYWRLQPGAVSLPRDDRQWTEAFADVLESAVRRHLDSDVAVGCMVSGGMDSSSLAVIARDQLAAAGRGPLATFSSIDHGPDCPETRAIHAVLAQPGFAPTLIDPDTIESLRGEIDAAMWQSEEPFDGSMLLLHAQYLMAARTGVGAVMDGIDADTLLSEGTALSRQVGSLHWPAAWRNARGRQRIYPGLKAGKAMLQAARTAVVPDWLRRATWAPRQRREATQVARDSLLAPDFARRIDLPARLDTHARWHYPGIPRTPAAQAARAIDHPNTTLGFERYHRVAAWHGVDPRHPFNDRAVMELCVNLPDNQRLREGWTKWVLRDAMRGRLPDPVCWRTGKEHLGWSLIQQLLLRDANGALQRLDSYRPLLAPYVDLARLDQACRRYRDQPDAQASVFEALHLGSWLQRHRR